MYYSRPNSICSYFRSIWAEFNFQLILLFTTQRLSEARSLSTVFIYLLYLPAYLLYLTAYLLYLTAYLLYLTAYLLYLTEWKREVIVNVGKEFTV